MPHRRPADMVRYVPNQAKTLGDETLPLELRLERQLGHRAPVQVAPVQRREAGYQRGGALFGRLPDEELDVRPLLPRLPCESRVWAKARAQVAHIQFSLPGQRKEYASRPLRAVLPRHYCLSKGSVPRPDNEWQISPLILNQSAQPGGDLLHR